VASSPNNQCVPKVESVVPDSSPACHGVLVAQGLHLKAAAEAEPPPDTRAKVRCSWPNFICLVYSSWTLCIHLPDPARLLAAPGNSTRRLGLEPQVARDFFVCSRVWLAFEVGDHLLVDESTRHSQTASLEKFVDLCG